MLRKSGKIFLFFAIFFIFSMLSSVMISAAEVNVSKGVPNLDGVFDPDEWDEASKYVMDKNCILAYNGVYPDTASMTDARGVICYLLWDDAGLYMGVDVKDNTPTFTTTWDAHGENSGVKSDLFQIVMWAKDAGKWMDVGMYKDGKLAPRGHDSVTDPLDNNFEGKMTGKGAVKSDGSGYYMECFMPWDVVGVDAAYKEGLSIPVVFMYVDMNGEEQVFYKSIDVDAWPPSDDVDNYLVLGAPYVQIVEVESVAEAAPAEAAPVESAPAAIVRPTAPATVDNAILYTAIALVMLCGTIVLLKKRTA